MVESDLNSHRTVRCHMYPTAHSTQDCAESAMTPLRFPSSVLILCLCSKQPLQDFASLTAEGPISNPCSDGGPQGCHVKEKHCVIFRKKQNTGRKTLKYVSGMESLAEKRKEHILIIWEHGLGN